MFSSSNPVETLTASVGVQSHPGNVRAENQDRISRAATVFGDLYLLADGVGGHKGGAQAAQDVVDGFVHYLNLPRQKNPIGALKAAAAAVSSDLRTRGETSEELAGMSSTVVLALVSGSGVIIGHAGDSRAYLLRDSQLRQLTQDHSVMQRLITENGMSPAEAGRHPDASVLTRALGQFPAVELETLELDLLPGDALLLCSDGLWGYTTQEEMQRVVLSQNLSVRSIAEALLNLALIGGGGDNVSIQFIHFVAALPVFVKQPSTRAGLSRAQILVAAGAAAVLLITGLWMAISNARHNPADVKHSVVVNTKSPTTVVVPPRLPTSKATPELTPPTATGTPGTPRHEIKKSQPQDPVDQLKKRFDDLPDLPH